MSERNERLELAPTRREASLTIRGVGIMRSEGFSNQISSQSMSSNSSAAAGRREVTVHDSTASVFTLNHSGLFAEIAKREGR